MCKTHDGSEHIGLNSLLLHPRFTFYRAMPWPLYRAKCSMLGSPRMCAQHSCDNMPILRTVLSLGCLHAPLEFKQAMSAEIAHSSTV